MRRLGGPARFVIGTLAVVAFLFVFVFPTQAYLAQRDEVADVESDLETLRAQNELLAEEAARLNDPAEIEELARERFNLVRPGEQAYAVIPGAPQDAVPAPAPSAPATGADSDYTPAD